MHFFCDPDRGLAVPAGIESVTFPRKIALMQIVELVELAALLAVQGRSFLHGLGRLSDSGIRQYWSASRRRLDGWCLAMADGGQADGAKPLSAESWATTRPVLEEVFATDVLTRIWTALAGEFDRRKGTSYVLPVVRSIQLGHDDARNRALNRMFHAQEDYYDEVLLVNRLRRRAERWTDMLLAHLADNCDVMSLAFEKERVQQFAADIASEAGSDGWESTWLLMKVAMRTAFTFGVTGLAPSAKLNRRIASGLLACFHPEMFESTGALSFLWMERLDYATSDLEALVEELLETEQPGCVPFKQPSSADPWVCGA